MFCYAGPPDWQLYLSLRTVGVVAVLNPGFKYPCPIYVLGHATFFKNVSAVRSCRLEPLGRPVRVKWLWWCMTTLQHA